ncbi:MAG: xanthine dehydrogenase family protein subunit M [Gemmatimonadota bacterium]
MIPAAFDYVRAKSLRDALNALALKDGSKLIAGGHSLIPLMRFRLAAPTKLVDVGGLEELKGIEEKGRGARIGAATTYRELLDSPLIKERFPVMYDAVSGIADLQVRNRGTVGGGIAHADPASDMPAVMLALGATMSLRSKAGKRSVAAAEFFTGPFVTAMADDEMLIDIIVPPLPRGAGSAYVSFEQQASGYALAAVAAVIGKSRKTVNHASVAITGVSESGAYLMASAALLIGTNADSAALDAASAGATEGITVNSDIHAPADYRAHLARVAARRAIALASSRA